jgi:hypothetical protein
MWHAVPVKDLLLLLRSDAVVLVEEVKERALWLLEGRVVAGFEVSQIGKDALLEFLGVFDGTSKSVEAEGETSNNVGARDVEEATPA